MKQFFTCIALILIISMRAQITPTLINQSSSDLIEKPHSIAHYKGYIYMPDSENNRILKRSINTTDTPVQVFLTDVEFPTAVKIIGDEMYFLQAISRSSPTNKSGKLSKINLTHSTPTIIDIITGLSVPHVLEGTATEMYITEIIGTLPSTNYDDFDGFDDFVYEQTQISKINLNGTISKTIIFKDRESIANLSLNGDFLYWIESEVESIGGVYRYNTKSTFDYPDYAFILGESDYMINMCINNNVLYFLSGKDYDIKSIDLDMFFALPMAVSMPFKYNKQQVNLSALLFLNNSIYVTAYYNNYDELNPVNKDLLYKVDLTSLSVLDHS